MSTKSASAWLVIFCGATAAAAASTATYGVVTVEDRTFHPGLFLIGLAATFALGWVTVVLAYNAHLRRAARIQKRLEREQREADAAGRELDELERREKLTEENRRKRQAALHKQATDPTEKLPVFAIYGSRPKADKPAVMYDRLRQQVAFDLTEQTGDIRK
jgi:hypothetical protein